MDECGRGRVWVVRGTEVNITQDSQKAGFGFPQTAERNPEITFTYD